MFRELVTLVVAVSSATVLADTWEPVTNAETVKALFSEKKIVATISEGNQSEAYYHSDGTAEVNAWGASFERQWKVKGNGDACLLIDGVWNCFTIEQSAENSGLYRATHLKTSQQITFSESKTQLSIADVDAQKVGGEGGAAQPSADEVARELANPNNSLASLTFKFQYRTYTGDLPDAKDQDSTTLVFQPVFPFSLSPTESGGKANLFVRPGIPVFIDQPIPEVAGGNFDYKEVSGLGDIGFDVGYGVTEKNGMLWAVGMVGTLPTATKDEIAGKQFRLGPEFLIARFYSWGVLGLFPSHQWDVGGWGDGDDYSYSNTQLQAVAKFLPGGGWNVGTSPIMNYDWKSEEWTIPLNLSISKTLMFGKTPVKLAIDINYYVEQPDAFGPDWMIGFDITPVVPNFVDQWLRN